jgi:hypothetical protein
MIKRIIAVFLIMIMFCSGVFAGNFTVKLEKIYPAGNKMMVSWEEGKKSALLVAVKEEGPTVNLTTHFKVGGMYPASYTNNLYTELIVYDDNGNTQKFIDDTNSRLLEEAKAKDAKAQEEAQLKSDQEVPWVILGITLAVLGAIVIVKSVESSTATDTSK